jgi:hypothetical protein
MPVKDRRGSKRREELSAEAEAWLRGDDHVVFAYFETTDDLAALWGEHGAAIVAEHVGEAPGTRPRRWWQYDAPEPRRRLGGVGTPSSERLANLPRYERGVPLDWIAQETIDTYVGLGIRLDVPAVDPCDPPTFESEAAYLDRLGLLLPGERRRLRPNDFKPEACRA